MRAAIIDLGTNTCNLLIASVNSSDYKILHQSKQLVKLGDDKIKANQISPEATKRTINAFDIHKEIIKKYNVEKIRVLATSAVRSAENKINFLEEASENSGWIVKLVSGEKEAELIFKGVSLAFESLDTPSVILDIGGGSNELILTNNKEMIWKESQPTGMARIINQFHISDPIKTAESQQIRTFFSAQHKEAFKKCREQNIQSLIGCSGAFDTIADIMDQVDPGEKSRITQEIPLSLFYDVYEKLINSTREERIKMKGMDMVRVDLIVPAVILIEQLIKAAGIKQITQTDFALREGALYELLHSN